MNYFEYFYKLNQKIINSPNVKLGNTCDEFNIHLIASDFLMGSKTLFVVLPTLTLAQKYYDSLASILPEEDVLFFPADDEEYLKLLTIYHLFDGVQTLDYEYTPHVTLGYYNINGFDVYSVEKLEKLVNKINKDEFEMFIDTEDLFYQHFTSMNDYKNIFPII